METLWSELAGVPDTRCYWVAVERDQVVGYTGLMASPPDSDIQTIAVAVTHRGRGVGDQLMVTAIAEATRRRCRWLMLEVEADNDPARSLYERHGFEAPGQGGPATTGQDRTRSSCGGRWEGLTRLASVVDRRDEPLGSDRDVM